MRGLRLMAVGQGVALVGLGAWPIVAMRTFERVTGPKHDDWLVRTVGGLCVAIGAGLLAGSGRPTVVRPLGVASAATFLATDVIGYRSGRLGAVYLLDAVAEAALIGGWAAASAPGAATGLRRAVRRALGRRTSSARGTPSALIHPGDPAAMSAHVAVLLDEAQHLVERAWPRSAPPPPIRESLRRLRRTAQRLAEVAGGDVDGLDEAELRRLAMLTAAASEEAASVQEAAFLVSS
jgi:hypothetical protein